MKILYTSLFPEESKQHEYENLEYFIEQSKKYDIEDLFMYRLFSAHKYPVDYFKDFYDIDEDIFNMDKKMAVAQLNFEYDERMNERRGHEISFCKVKIFQFNIDVVAKYDYLFFTDSDIQINSREVHELCKSLYFNPNSFVNIPYALRDLKVVSEISFGCYIIPSSIIMENKDLYSVIYNIFENQDGELCRIGAPDCNIRNALLKRGYKELRALLVNTKHYLNRDEYVEFDNGEIRTI